MRHCRPRVPPIPTIIHSIPHRSLPLHLPLTIPPTSMSAAASVVLGGGGPRPGRRRARPPRRFPSISIAFTSGEKPCGLLSPPAAAGGAMAAARGEGPAAVGGAEAEYMESGGRAPVVMVAAAVARDSAGSPASCCCCCGGGGGVGAAASVRPVLLLPVVVAVVPVFLPSFLRVLAYCLRAFGQLLVGRNGRRTAPQRRQQPVDVAKGMCAKGIGEGFGLRAVHAGRIGRSRRRAARAGRHSHTSASPTAGGEMRDV